MERLTRREMVQSAAIPLAASAVSACLEKDRHQIKQDLYQGPVEFLVGKSLVTKSEIDGMLKALESSSYPFLGKMSADLQSWLKASSNPQKLPNWVSSKSYPIQVVQSDSPTSLAIYESYHEEAIPQNFYSIEFGGKSYNYYLLKDPILTIQLGITADLARAPALYRALFLAKEYLSHMINLRVATEFYEYVTKHQWFKVLDSERQEPRDPKKRERISMSMLLYQLKNENETAWQILDAVPHFIIGAALISLMNKKVVPNPPGYPLHPFYLAAVQLTQEDINLLRSVVDIMNAWQSSGEMMPPLGTTVKLFSPPISQACLTLQQEIKESMKYVLPPSR